MGVPEAGEGGGLRRCQLSVGLRLSQRAMATLPPSPLLLLQQQMKRREHQPASAWQAGSVEHLWHGRRQPSCQLSSPTQGLFGLPLLMLLPPLLPPLGGEGGGGSIRRPLLRPGLAQTEC